jgi:nucleotide-binding universal stress UspA family protein
MLKQNNMKKIIVPTDFSPVSVNAANFAADMAAAINAELLLVHVYQVPVGYLSGMPLALLSMDELKKDSESLLDELKQKIETHSCWKVRIETRAVLGDTIDELEKLCKEVKPFVVVMGAKGRSGIEKIVFGSITLSAIRHLNWPVLGIPSGKVYGEGIRKIGFACDLKDVADSTPAKFIREMVYAFDAELHILHVDHNDKHFTPGSVQESYDLHYLFHDLEAKYHFLNCGDIEDGISDFAVSNDLDLIIAVPKKHKLLEGMFRQSSTRQLIFQSQVPVMCIHE